MSGATEARWRELRALLERALEAAPEERRRLLGELGREDPARAAELAELLRADAMGDSPLDAGAAPLLAAVGGEATNSAAGAAPPLAGRQLGAWRLGGLLGQGGMGAVYAARRADGAFEQEAAVKVLRTGADAPELRARFRLERQLLASLEHPAIARLLDGGLSEDGILWFALERVEGGLPITRWADEHALALPARIDLFLEVCDAVEAAHRRLIVHRDLKPSNILVTPAGRPKLLDFGIAKVLDREESGTTRTGAQMLTPQYAAPEQILGEVPTTAVDVYALGVVLYELVTGALPHQRTTSSPVALARELARETVSAPSRRVAAGGGGKRRGAARISADLDAIVLKALRAEPEARYRAVAELAADLGRCRAGLPVAARGGARAYRARRFVARHRLAVAAVAAVALSLLLGLAGILAQARIARAERDRALVEADTARQVAGFMTRLFQQADPARTRGASLTAREVLDAGARAVGTELSAQPEIQATLLLAIGSVERDLGGYDEAQPLLERALELRERLFGAEALETAEALHELGSLDRYLDRLELGTHRLERALAIRESRLGSEHLDVARTHAQLGVVCRFAGDPASARQHFVTALAIAERLGAGGDETGRWLNNLGLVEADLGERAAAERAYRRSLARLEASSGPDNPLLALPLDNLGMLLRGEERFDEALPLLERARDLVARTWGEDHAQFGTALNSLGVLLADVGRCPEALPLFERSAAVYSRALGSEHRAVAWPLTGAGDCGLTLGDPRAALALFERAAAIRAAAFGPDHTELAESLGRIGLAESALDRHERAEASHRAALAMLRRTTAAGSTVLGEQLVDLAACLERRGTSGEARDLYREADAIFRAAYPEGHSYRVRVADALARLDAQPRPAATVAGSR